uniref:TSA: Wollemia nobilis Ref_Wollemi_Transcript_1525_3050 transcribed RNA sequence n=1 Tax=Wollemia nobilis TaxID=56998 RepID=A0A0C9SAX4_9CONI
MAPSKLRKVVGTVKDQTSIGIAKVAGTRAPDLDVAIVKATSHDEIPTDEKYVREILHLTSYSRGYVNACVASLSKRLGKTHNWIVALKAVGLIHRLLRDGDPSFEHEVLHATRRGARLLNLSDFRDDSHSNAWDYSAFVRTYALYLDERLDCALADRKQLDGRPRIRERRTGYNGYEYSDGDHGSNGYNSYGSGYNNYEVRRQEDSQHENVQPRTIRDMKSEMVFDKIHRWQRVLERFLACRPTGFAKCNRLVNVALYTIVNESFQLYGDICEGLVVLLDRFFDMEYDDCTKAFDTYSRAAKQIDELVSFYNLCKTMGICRTSEYPDVQKVSEKLLETLEDFLRERSSSRNQRPKSPEPEPEKPQSPQVESKESTEDLNHIKALPAPGDDAEKEPEGQQISNKKYEGDLLNLDQDPISSEEQENKFALALFTGSSEFDAAKKWEAFPTDNGSESRGRASAWETPLAETGRAGWELALVESASNLAKQRNSMAGRFDHLVLEGLYDQAAAQQQHMSQLNAPGSASSVVMPGQHKSSMLALPAPIAQTGDDPFAASLNVPPPSYVQMSDMAKKQQLLVQEQQLWLQYQKDGMQGQHGIMNLCTNSYGMAPLNSYGMPSYGMPRYGMGGYVQSYPATY